MIYLLIEIIRGLAWLLFIFLAYGVPLLALVQIARNLRKPLKAAVWAAFGVFWITPSIVEYIQQQRIRTWIDSLPPSPLIELPKETVLAMKDGFYSSDGVGLYFETCASKGKPRDFCNFHLGFDAFAKGIYPAYLTDDGAEFFEWKYSENCHLPQSYAWHAEIYEAFATAQSLCAHNGPIGGNKVDYVVALIHGGVPGVPGFEYGQLVLTDHKTKQVLTTLTSFERKQPDFPVVWGVHWVPIISGFIEPRSQQIIYGKAEYSDNPWHVAQKYPPNSIQNLAYAAQHKRQYGPPDQIFPQLEAVFGYDANRALPALKTGQFEPTRLAVRIVCEEHFRSQITPEVVAEIRRLAVPEKEIGNGHPNDKAKEALEDGCAKYE